MKNKKGFTLIELLVVIAIIGLLSTLAVVALNNARIKSRDARRVSDIKQTQTALELYLNDVGHYPEPPAATEACADAVGDLDTCCISSGTAAIQTACTGTTYMAQVPSDPLNNATYYYLYAQALGDDSTYQLTYELEGPTAGITSGERHTATPAGMVDD